MVSIGGCGPLDRGFKSHLTPIYMGSNPNIFRGDGLSESLEHGLGQPDRGEAAGGIRTHDLRVSALVVQLHSPVC